MYPIFFIGKSTINRNTKVETNPITIALVTAAKMIEVVTSVGDNGAYSKSTIFPCIFDIIKELVEWEKLWSIIDCIISPGARKIINE